MANIDVKDFDGARQTVKTTDNGGVHTPHHNIDSMPADPLGSLADAAITTDTTGSLSGKLRGLVKWAFERMPAALGRLAPAASLSVAVSTDPLPNKVSTANSSTANLGNGATFTGTGEDMSGYQGVAVSVLADEASATDGLKIEFSSDDTNWDLSHIFTISADVAAWFTIPVQAKWFRVRYTNGTTPQTAFRLQSLLLPTLPGIPTVFPADQQGLPFTLGAGSDTIGRVQIRNNADAANIDPVAESTFTGRIGEVQASPTANTVLDRLKALLTGIVLAAGSARIGKVTVRDAANAADIDPLAEATFTGRIGEVQASPTSNTLLARLKDILTGIVLATGSNVVGHVGLEPRTSGGLSVARYLDLGLTGQVAKGSAGQVYGWRITNQRAGALYVKIYNKATTPTDSDTPIITIALLQGQAETDSFPHGIAFATGIGVRASTGIADNDTGAPGTNEAVVNLFYK